MPPQYQSIARYGVKMNKQYENLFYKNLRMSNELLGF